MPLNKTTDITPVVNELKELQRQLAREFQQTRELIKTVALETQGVKKELQDIKSVLIDIRNNPITVKS